MCKNLNRHFTKEQTQMAKRLRKGTQPGKRKSNQEIKMKATKRNCTNPPEWLKFDRLTSAGSRATETHSFPAGGRQQQANVEDTYTLWSNNSTPRHLFTQNYMQVCLRIQYLPIHRNSAQAKMGTSHMSNNSRMDRQIAIQ